MPAPIEWRTDAEPRWISYPLSEMQLAAAHAGPLGLQVRPRLEDFLDPRAMPRLSISVGNHGVSPMPTIFAALGVVHPGLTSESSSIILYASTRTDPRCFRKCGSSGSEAG